MTGHPNEDYYFILIKIVYLDIRAFSTCLSTFAEEKGRDLNKIYVANFSFSFYVSIFAKYQRVLLVLMLNLT